MTGTDDSEWRPWLHAPDVRPFPDQRYTHAVVVAAHPDDETLGASGLLQRLHADGTSAALVVATDGEAAFPSMSTEDRRELGRIRRAELRFSLQAQGLGHVRPFWLGLPDSALAEHRDELTDRLRPLLADAETCLVPWPGDPHPDHRAAGVAALAAAPVTTHCWSYPIWMWHWMTPDDPAIPRSKAFVHRLDRKARDRKATGLGAFTSQLKPGPRGEDPILQPEMLRHFDRDVEVFFREPPVASAPIERFVDIYAGQDDPWRVADVWYEQRKRAVALAALPRERYGVAIEPACGTGVFTRELAGRCDRVVAFDPVPAAVAHARRHTEGLGNVSVTTGALPGDLPDGPADLVVFSEILYYLDDEAMAASVDRAVSALRPGGHVLAVDWLPWAAEAPRDGVAVHRFLCGHPMLEPVVEHTDERFVLHVLTRR